MTRQGVTTTRQPGCGIGSRIGCEPIRQLRLDRLVSRLSVNSLRTSDRILTYAVYSCLHRDGTLGHDRYRNGASGGGCPRRPAAGRRQQQCSGAGGGPGGTRAAGVQLSWFVDRSVRCRQSRVSWASSAYSRGGAGDPARLVLAADAWRCVGRPRQCASVIGSPTSMVAGWQLVGERIDEWPPPWWHHASARSQGYQNTGTCTIVYVLLHSSAM